MSSSVDIKVVMLGQAYASKSSLVKRYITGKFDDKYMNTVGAAFDDCKFTVNLQRFRMGIWYTAGQERYHSILKIYYRHSYAAIICYDPLDLESFQSVKYWIQELQKISDRIKIYICATKQDIIEAKKKVVVDAKDVQDLIKKYLWCQIFWDFGQDWNQCQRVVLWHCLICLYLDQWSDYFNDFLRRLWQVLS